MNYKRCVYFVEGLCEKQLIDALKAELRLLTPGKVNVHNVIQDEIPRRVVNTIKVGTTVVFAFDTDVEKTDSKTELQLNFESSHVPLSVILFSSVTSRSLGSRSGSRRRN